MAGLVGLLGDQVTGKDGNVDVTSFAKEGRVVGLYFSAHWCPPCRGFTPELAKWYNDFKASERGSLLEIVFVSSDQDEDGFKEYFGEMPWLALPYEKRDEKDKLSEEYKVEGIPTLVFLEADTGSVLNTNGQAVVGYDPLGAKFPWPEKSLSEVLQGPVLSKDGQTELADAMKGKVLGIYFSAHWCGACRDFTPKLIETYNKLEEAGKNFEIVFASFDHDEEGFDDCYKDMPWLALPFGDDRKDVLEHAHFDCSEIPRLILLDENLEVITQEGCGAIGIDPDGQDFPWIPPPLQELTQMNANSVNDMPCLIFLTGQDDTHIQHAKDVMQEVAEETVAKQKASEGTENEIDPLLICYESKRTGDLTESLREFLKLEQGPPCLVYISIDEGVKYISDKTTFTKDDIKEIVEKIQAGTIETVSLQD